MVNSRLLVILYWFILLSPVWIRFVSIKPWRLSTKKITIVSMVIISFVTAIYGFLRPQANPSSWSTIGGKIILVIYFIVVLLSAYFNWPQERGKFERLLVDKPKRKSTIKNRTYVLVPLMTGSDGDATVTFHNATFQKVSETIKRYPDPDFGPWLIDQIYNAKKIMAERRGVLKKRLFCPACETELSHENWESKQMEFELQYKEFDPFVMQIAIPAVVCRQCTRTCGVDLDGSLNNHLSEAIIVAFRSENIRP